MHSDNNSLQKKLALFSILLIWNSLSAQTWNNFQTVGNEGSDGIDLIAPLSDGSFIAAGTFTESIEIGDQNFTAQGRQDLWLAKFDEQGKIEWAIQGSSPQEDVNGDLKIGNDGTIYWSGTFWQTGQFGNFILEPPIAQKSIFILKINPDGVVENGAAFYGSGAKDLSEIEIDTTQNIFLTGNFSNTISFQNFQFTADETDIFLTKLDSNFNLTGWQQIKGNQTTNAGGLGLLSNGEVLIAGDFQGELILENDTIATRTPDEDLFYAKFDSNGQPFFLRKAGGALPAFCESVEVDFDDNFYLIGNHRGRITVDNNLEIETEGQNDNFYLISLDANGNSRWGKSLGSKGNDAMENAFLFENEILLAGNYTEEMTIDQTQVSFPINLLNNGFFASFSIDDGSVNWVHTTQGSEFILGKAIAKNDNQIWAGGDFSQEIVDDDLIFETMGFFDFFLGEINPSGSVSIDEVSNAKSLIFPNPTSGIFQTTVRNAHVSLYSINGKLLKEFQNEEVMDVSEFAAGLYLLQVKTPDFFYSQKLIKK